MGSPVREWIDEVGMETCQDYLSSLRAKGLRKIYISNFEFIPTNFSSHEFCSVMNEDAGDWIFYVEDDDVVAELRR